VSIHLLVPGPFDAVSGGYIYDRRMVEGLRALGEAVAVVELPGRHPVPDEAASEGARAALAALPAQTFLTGTEAEVFRPLAGIAALLRADTGKLLPVDETGSR